MMVLFGGMLSGVKAQSASDLKWSEICAGKMGADWYGSDEAKTIADKVLAAQKNSGGWMKNIEFHKINDPGGWKDRALLSRQHSHHAGDALPG